MKKNKMKKKCDYLKEVKKGTLVEMEHAHLFPKIQRKSMAEKIAKDHLKEHPCYYQELKKMEKRLMKK